MAVGHGGLKIISPSGLGDANSLVDELDLSLEGDGVGVFVLVVGRSVEVLFQPDNMKINPPPIRKIHIALPPTCKISIHRDFYDMFGKGR